MYIRTLLQPASGNTVLVFGNKPEINGFFRGVFGGDIRLISVTTKGIRKRHRAGYILLPCDFRCSLRGCLARLIFAHNNRQIPFCVVRFLPLDNHILNDHVFSLSIFEIDVLSSSQEKIISKLRFSESYSRNLISQFHQNNMVSKVLALETEIVENPNEFFNLKKSAETVGLSACWISSNFRKITHMPMKRFINKLRFCYTLWRIIASDLPIKNIAIEAGYRPLSFSKQFKGHFGLSPSYIRDNFHYLAH